MIQSVRHEYKDAYSFAQQSDMRKQEFPFQSGCERSKFLSPDNMVEAIKKYCQKTGQPVPESRRRADLWYIAVWRNPGETVRFGEDRRTYDSIHIIGGGSNAAYLNQLTAILQAAYMRVGQDCGADGAGPGEAKS